MVGTPNRSNEVSRAAVLGLRPEEELALALALSESLEEEVRRVSGMRGHL